MAQELNYEEFKERIELSSLCFDVHNHSIEANYHDMTEDADPESQIFGGHLIEVPINDDGSFGKPYLSG